MRIGDIGGVVIECRQRANTAAHHRHRMGIAAETGEEARHLFVNHGVMGHAMIEILLLRLGRQFAVEQQIADLQEIAMFGKLLDRVSAMQTKRLHRHRCRLSWIRMKPLM